MSFDAKKRMMLERSLQEWYAEDADRKKQLDRIVSGGAEFSLREIDWFVTNYTARNPVVYTLPSGKVVDVNGDYKDVLKSFHKSAFDAFKRKGNDPGDAAIRQMNFFRWAMENGVVDYVAKNARIIEQDMSRMRKKQKVACSPKRQPQGMGVAIKTIDAVLTIPSYAVPEW